MCLYPKLIKNKRYLPTRKNGWVAPPCPDERLRYITAECGKCLECREQKRRGWQVRMNEEIRQNPNAYFVTLTFTNEKYEEYENKLNTKNENIIATKAIRECLERIRKKTKKSVKHWFITEKGHEGTERLHLHGIVWGIGTDKLFEEKWNNGIVWVGHFVNEATINYITKYMTKVDEVHPNFIGKVLCSPGIGKGFIERPEAKKYVYKKGETIEHYITRQGVKLNLPIYYRNKLFTEEEREKLFIDKLNKGIVWVRGQKIHINNHEEYMCILMQEQKKAERLTKSTPRNWEQQKYIQRIKAQREYYTNKIDEIYRTSQRKEKKAQQRLDTDLDLFAAILNQSPKIRDSR